MSLDGHKIRNRRDPVPPVWYAPRLTASYEQTSMDVLVGHTSCRDECLWRDALHRVRVIVET